MNSRILVFAGAYLRACGRDIIHKDQELLAHEIVNELWPHLEPVLTSYESREAAKKKIPTGTILYQSKVDAPQLVGDPIPTEIALAWNENPPNRGQRVRDKKTGKQQIIVWVNSRSNKTDLIWILTHELTHGVQMEREKSDYSTQLTVLGVLREIARAVRQEGGDVKKFWQLVDDVVVESANPKFKRQLETAISVAKEKLRGLNSISEVLEFLTAHGHSIWQEDYQEIEANLAAGVDSINRMLMEGGSPDMFSDPKRFWSLMSYLAYENEIPKSAEQRWMQVIYRNLERGKLGQTAMTKLRETYTNPESVEYQALQQSENPIQFMQLVTQPQEFQRAASHRSFWSTKLSAGPGT